MAPGGAAVVSHVVDGTRLFALVPNTDYNRRLFVTWYRHARGPGCFMADYAQDPVLVEVGGVQCAAGWHFKDFGM